MEKYSFTSNEKMNLWAYMISICTITIGGGVYTFAISYFLLNETGSALYFSINLAISSITFLLISPISGVLTDFLNRRYIIIYGELILTITILILLIVTYFYGLSLLTIYITTFIRGIFNALVNNSFSAATSNMFHIDNLQKVFGLNSSVQSSAAFLGPILGGVFFGIFSFEIILIIFLILSLISLLLDYTIKFDLFRENSKDENSSFNDHGYLKGFYIEIKNGVKYLLSIPILKVVIFAGVAINFFNAGDMVLPEKMMIDLFNFSPVQVGIVNGIMALGAVIAGLFLANTKKVKNQITTMKYCFIFGSIITIVLPIPIYIDIAFTFQFIYIATLLFFKFFIISIINVPFMRIIHEQSNDNMKGRVFSGLGVISSSIVPIAIILFGYIYDQGFYILPNLISGIIIILIAIIFYKEKKLVNN